MTVGQDTYVTAAEADAYAAAHYRSNSKQRTAWNAVPAEDREVLLVNACQALELLPFQGRKADRLQAMAFPRLPGGYGVPAVPERVKAAQIELAMWLANDAAAAEREQRQTLQDQGVTAMSLGDLSETYDLAAAQRGARACPKVRELLAPYFSGGYGMR